MQVLKRKLRQGRGTFPIDAPVNDATVRLHYSVAPVAQPDKILFTTCKDLHRFGEMPDRVAQADKGEDGFQFTTGEGVMPVGVEMAVKIMLPGEVCGLTVAPEFGLRTCAEGETAERFNAIYQEEDLHFVLWLVSFDVEGHPQAMDAEQVCSVAGTVCKDPQTVA
jgi:hypothetical protein